MLAKKRVVMDSSAMIACLEEGRDFFDALRDTFEGGLEVVVPSSVVNELRKLAARGGKRGAAACLALQLLEKGSNDVAVRVINVGAERPDEALLELAAELDAYLITLDRELRKAAEARGIVALTYIRSKRRFG